ncbi:uracil phosphoribosyltransferase [Singulisphaera acidiphila]|uniref:Uracil phosphoribosyltransferase n=1 Tax=Singulisphaera acidiphila (strain ATCC BAA-1392 / DSM 18658 / VKM B-2454 / MOB10) TaxID=886293 RepID=L0DAC8_SINAD|nr:uracil phosphoribosyltransferase [Singulisphaera acidiphila]AGA25810.1 uracil phosphoribosyltransferase [Singulisphaera acidiphila DSM 18658]
MSLVFPSSHPIVLHLIANLRDARTRPPEFRRLVRTLAMLLAQEATLDLPTRPLEVPTPLGPSPAWNLADTIGIVPILRAGLGMAEGILDLIPDAQVWHVGVYRDEQTLQPMEYYKKLPANPKITIALVVDPMLATGGSAVHACTVLKAAGVTRMKLISLIAAPEGIAHMNEAMPDVPIHVGVVDDHLNEVGYIYPGLGDAGDRQFATALD